MHDNFAAQLRERGCKATPARLAILLLLEREKKPLSVERILARLPKRALDYVTAYRTVTLLKELGMVRQIDFHHGHAHYELASLGDHHHVVCVQCNAVTDIPHRNSHQMLQTALADSGFSSITDHSLEFFGVCSSCSSL